MLLSASDPTLTISASPPVSSTEVQSAAAVWESSPAASVGGVLKPERPPQPSRPPPPAYQPAQVSWDLGGLGMWWSVYRAVQDVVNGFMECFLSNVLLCICIALSVVHHEL